MSTASYDFTIEAGTTFRRTLRFYQDAERTVPVDLTGFAIAACMLRNMRRIEFTAEITDDAGGEAEISLAPNQTANAPVGVYAWDLLLRAPSGSIEKTFKGSVTLNDTATVLT